VELTFSSHPFRSKVFNPLQSWWEDKEKRAATFGATKKG